MKSSLSKQLTHNIRKMPHRSPTIRDVSSREDHLLDQPHTSDDGQMLEGQGDSTVVIGRRVCRHTGCPNIARKGGRCGKHQDEQQSSSSPQKAAASTTSSPARRNKRKQHKRKIIDNEPLFAFDTAREETKKRRIKTITRFDPTKNGEGTGCKIGHGFLCPQCSATNGYDSRQCYQCLLECCYEAGVGVVVLQERRISYNKRPSPTKKKSTIEQKQDGRISYDKRPSPTKKKSTMKKKKRSTMKKKQARVDNKKKSADNAPTEGGIHADKASASSTSTEKKDNGSGEKSTESSLETDEMNIEDDHDVQATSFKNVSNKAGRKENIFANLKDKLKVATQSHSEGTAAAAQDENNDDGAAVANRVRKATEEWTESTIAASKYGAYSSTSSSNLPTFDEDGQSSESSAAAAAKSVTEAPSPEADMNTCNELREQLLALQSKHDSILPNAIKADEEFKDVMNKLEATILQRNTDAAAFGETIAFSSAKIAEIKKGVALLTSERDEFVKRLESKGLPPVTKSEPNYSTRVDVLQSKLSQMKTDCDTAKERVKDLMSGSEVAKQEKAKATHNLEEMETTHGETFTQCYKEIESFKQQLYDATSKIATMATEKAELVEKVSSTLIYVSRVRKTAEDQRSRISELEASMKTLTAQLDAALKQRKKEFANITDYS